MKTKKGFTLVELLVVIAIIALLLSILMPALNKARESGKRVRCMANLHQLVLALQFYQQDFKEAFPTDKDGIVATYARWGGNRGKAPGYDNPNRMLNPYIGVKEKAKFNSTNKSLGVFFCPSDRGGYGGAAKTMLGKDWLPTLGYWLGYSYDYNVEALSGSATLGLWGKKQTDIKNPTKTIVFFDGSMACYAYGYIDIKNPFQFRYWHHKKELGWGSASFVDGHIEFFRVSDKPNIANRPAWWKGSTWTFRVNSQ